MADDSFIANRILWRAGKHGLPANDTYVYGDEPNDITISIAKHCAGYRVGNMVLVFTTGNERWTVVGTRMAISYFDSKMRACPYRNITNLTNASPLQKKHQMEFVTVTLDDGSQAELWGPSGSQFFGLWNILLGLSRMSHDGPTHLTTNGHVD